MRSCDCPPNRATLLISIKKQMFRFDYGTADGIISPPIPKECVPGEVGDCEAKSNGSITRKDTALSDGMTGQIYLSTIQQSWVKGIKP